MISHADKSIFENVFKCVYFCNFFLFHAATFDSLFCCSSFRIDHWHPIEEIDIQLKNRLVRKKSTDTTSGGSNVTVIEGVVQDEIVEVAKNTSGSDISDTVSAKNSSLEISKEIGLVFNYEPIKEISIEPIHHEVYSEPEINSEQEVESITQEEFNPPEIELETDVSEIVKEIVLENIEKFTTNEVLRDLPLELPDEATKEEEIMSISEIECLTEVHLQEFVETQPEFQVESLPEPIVEQLNENVIDFEDLPKEVPEPIIENVVEVLEEIIPKSLVEEIVIEEEPKSIVEETTEVVIEETPEPIEEVIKESSIEEAPEPDVQEIPEIVEEEIPESIIEQIAEPEVESITELIIEEIQQNLTKHKSPEPDQEYNELNSDLEKSIEILEEDLNKQPLPSCLSRRNSSRSSIKKKVNYTETTEVIPEQVYFINEDDLHHENPKDDDDDVFSDSIEPILPRGNMCTPYIPKRGSIPGLEALPDWFPNRLPFLFETIT